MVAQMTYSTLITCSELHRQLDNPNWRVVDCRFDLANLDAGLKAYQNGHIQGAIYAHLEHDLSGPVTARSGRHPLPEPGDFIGRLNHWGIDDDTQVIAYDDSNGTFAARLWWLLRWVGHNAIAVLDGGMTAWRQADYGITKELPSPPPLANHGLALDNTRWISTAKLDATLREQQLPLIDVRAPARFRGDNEPIDPVAGHIPGAVNIPFSSNLGSEGRFLPAEQLQAHYRSHLSDQALEHAVVMCGSGVTACHTLLALAVAGVDSARLYAGSWSEWIREPQRPVAKGG